MGTAIAGGLGAGTRASEQPSRGTATFAVAAAAAAAAAAKEVETVEREERRRDDAVEIEPPEEVQDLVSRAQWQWALGESDKKASPTRVAATVADASARGGGGSGGGGQGMGESGGSGRASGHAAPLKRPQVRP